MDCYIRVSIINIPISALRIQSVKKALLFYHLDQTVWIICAIGWKGNAISFGYRSTSTPFSWDITPCGSYTYNVFTIAALRNIPEDGILQNIFYFNRVACGLYKLCRDSEVIHVLRFYFQNTERIFHSYFSVGISFSRHICQEHGKGFS
jgi:hypothetical protein